jgi:hypothetical protein
VFVHTLKSTVIIIISHSLSPTFLNVNKAINLVAAVDCKIILYNVFRIITEKIFSQLITVWSKIIKTPPHRKSNRSGHLI